MSRKTPTKKRSSNHFKQDDLSAEDSSSSIGRPLLPTLVSPLQQHRLSCQEPFSQPDLTEYRLQEEEDSEEYEQDEVIQVHKSLVQLTQEDFAQNMTPKVSSQEQNSLLFNPFILHECTSSNYIQCQPDEQMSQLWPETPHSLPFLFTDCNNFSLATNLALAGKKRIRSQKQEEHTTKKNICHKVRESLGESGRQYLLRPSELQFCLEPRFTKPEDAIKKRRSNSVLTERRHLLSKRTRIDPQKLFSVVPRKGAKAITKKTKNIPSVQTRSMKAKRKGRKTMDDTGTETILNDSKEVLLRMFESANLPALPTKTGVCRVLIGEVMSISATSSQAVIPEQFREFNQFLIDDQTAELSFHEDSVVDITSTALIQQHNSSNQTDRL